MKIRLSMVNLEDFVHPDSGTAVRGGGFSKNFFCKRKLFAHLRSSAEICVLMEIEKVLYA